MMLSTHDALLRNPDGAFCEIRFAYSTTTNARRSFSTFPAIIRARDRTTGRKRNNRPFEFRAAIAPTHPRQHKISNGCTGNILRTWGRPQNVFGTSLGYLCCLGMIQLGTLSMDFAKSRKIRNDFYEPPRRQPPFCN